MSSPYLLKKSDTYYARFRVPDRHRKLLQQTEFKWSLCSNRKTEAHARCAFFRHLVVQVFSMLDELLTYTLTDSEERKIRIGLKRYLEDQIIAFREIVEGARKVDLRTLQTELQEEHSQIQVLKSALNRGFYNDPLVLGMMSRFLEFCPDRMSSYFDDANPDYRFLAQRGCQTEMQIHEGKVRLIRGQTAPLHPQQLSPRQATQRPKVQESDHQVAANGQRLSKAIKLYLEERSEHGLQEKSIQEYDAVLRRFREFLYDPEIQTIGRKDVRNFKSALGKFPQRLPNPLRGQNFNKVIELQHECYLSKESINKHLNRISSFFRWAIREEHLYGKNPAEGLEFKITSRPDEKRQRFSEADLKKLFNLGTFQGTKKIAKSAHYWAPLLSLYGGFRIEEICQLDIEDVSQEQSIWVISINNKGDKKVKNVSSTRTVPIHSKLIDFGFLDYVAAVSRGKHKKLFPSLTKHPTNGYSHNVTQWFGRQKNSLGFEKLTPTFHSFRHTVSDELKQKCVPEVIIAAIVGHEHGGITNNRYGKAYEPTILQTEVEKLDFDINVVRFSDKLLTPMERGIIVNQRKLRT